MNLILVDDEAISIETLQDGMDWHKLGIDNVFKAMSMKKACQLFQSEQIDIMICDIEMPQNNGLELLKWLRENNYQVVSIFLTGHADFKYAKKAIELRSMEYLLKPISFEKLGEIILKAVEEVKSNHEKLETKQFADKWYENKPKRLRNFWRDIVMTYPSSTLNEIVHIGANQNISVRKESVYIPLLVASKQSFYKTRSQVAKKDTDIRLSNIHLSIYEKSIAPLIFINSRKAVIILEKGNEKDIKDEIENIKFLSSLFIEKVNDNFNIVLSCIIGDICSADNLSKQFSRLLNMEESNVCDESCIMLLSEKANSYQKYNRPDIKLWAKYLKQNKLNTLEEKIDSYFEEQKKTGNLNLTILNQFQYDYIQMIYAQLEGNDISNYVIFNSQEDEELFAKAIISIANIKEWIKYVNAKTASYLTVQNNMENIIEEIKKYLDKNIYNDISRNDIAEEVNLNPEYLSRFFHKETGVHLIKYIQNEKVKKSKKLLCETDFGIGEIASMLGYSNFAYFSQLFKNITGFSPNAYRKKNKKS